MILIQISMEHRNLYVIQKVMVFMHYLIIGIDQIKEDRNPNLQILGILVNRYTERFTANRLLLEEIETAAEELGTVVFKSKIRQSVAMDEAQIMQTDIFSGKSPIAKDFDNFVSEFIERIK